jgi:hypothetical protein
MLMSCSLLDRLTHTDEDDKIFGVPDVLGILLGGNNFLHREAVTAEGMHSCSSVACSICNWGSDVDEKKRPRQIEATYLEGMYSKLGGRELVCDFRDPTS